MYECWMKKENQKIWAMRNLKEKKQENKKKIQGYARKREEGDGRDKEQ